MHYSKTLGREIIDSPHELDAQCWLFGSDEDCRAAAATNLARLDSEHLGRLLAEVMVRLRKNLACPSNYSDSIAETFGPQTKAGFDAAFEYANSWHSVKLLLFDVSLDGLIDGCAKLFTQQRFDDAFSHLAEVPDLDSTIIRLFIRKVGENGGSCANALYWLSNRLARR